MAGTGLIYFNPRTRVECDMVRDMKQEGVTEYFNPRTRVECDLTTKKRQKQITYFNPRTRVECDASEEWYVGLNDDISIHALV